MTVHLWTFFNEGLDYCNSLTGKWTDSLFMANPAVAQLTTDGYAWILSRKCSRYVPIPLDWPNWWPNWMPFGDAGEDVFNPIWNIADAAISVGVYLDYN